MIRPRKRKKESDEEFIQRASREYYNEGFNILEIADKLDADLRLVYNSIVPNRHLTTNEERALILKLVSEGESYRSIGRMLGLSHTCVSQRVKKAASTSLECMTDNILSEADIEYLKHEYQAGRSAGSIAKELNVSRSSCVYRLKKAGIYVDWRGVNRVTPKEVAKFKRLHKKGLSYAEIGRRCGRDKTVVRRYILK